MHTQLDRVIGDVRKWLGDGSLNFFGRPFAGKDTQAQLMAPLLDAHILGGGEILRNSVLAPEIKASMDRGDLIETDVYVDIVSPFLSDSRFAGRPLILSSVGRVRGEEQGVIEATAAAGHPIRATVMFEITAEESRRRRAANCDRGRDDDSAESHEQRLSEFAAKTQPVIDTYENMGLPVPVDAIGSPVDVLNSLVTALHSRATSA